MHETLVLIAYTQNFHLNTQIDESSEARDLNLDLNIHLHPHLVYARSEGSDDNVPMHRFADGALFANLMLYAK